jgi:hypothetical protein
VCEGRSARWVSQTLHGSVASAGKGSTDRDPAWRAHIEARRSLDPDVRGAVMVRGVVFLGEGRLHLRSYSTCRTLSERNDFPLLAYKVLSLVMTLEHWLGGF